MKKTVILFNNTLKRSVLILLVSLVGGILLCLMYSGMAQLYGQEYEGIPVGFYPHEETAVTDDLRGYLGDELGMQITESTNTEFLNTELVERHIAAVIEVPAGFQAAVLGGSEMPLQVSFLDDYANSAFVMGYLENYTASLATLAVGAAGSAEVLTAMMTELGGAMMPVNTLQSDRGAHVEATQEGAFRQVVGFYLMFGFMLAFGLSSQLLTDRKKGLYTRMKATNLRTVQYLAGTCLPSLLSAACLITPFFIYIAFTHQTTGIHIGQAVVLCLLYALFVVAVSIVTAMYLNTRNAITAAIVGTATITCMLGGAYFPLNTAPEFLQQLARVTPQFWFMDAVNVLQQDASADWWQQALIISLFALLGFIVAGVRFVQGGRRRRTA